MRICHYPGRAIDATLSLDQKSPMEPLYKNNWLNADKTIKTIGRSSAAVAQRNSQMFDDATTRTASTQHKYGRPYIQSASSPATQSPTSSLSSGGAHQSGSSDEENRRSSQSSLGRYQVTLEEMQKLDLNQSNELFKKTLRDLNGYKPSTVRQRHRRYYDSSWDEFRDEKPIANGNFINYNQLRTNNEDSKSMNWQLVNGHAHHPNNNGTNQMALIPKIKRSQTVRYTTSTNSDNINSRVNNLNIKNLFNQQNSGDPNKMMPTATINKNFNRFQRNNLLAIQNEFNRNSDNAGDPYNENGTHLTSNKLMTDNEFTTHSNQFTNKCTPVNGQPHKTNENCDNVNEKPQQNGKSTNKSLFRAKSVRINPTPIQDVHFDRPFSMHDPQQRHNGTNETSINCDNNKRATNNITNNGVESTFKQKLPRLTSIMKKKPIVVEQPQQQQQQQHSKEILSQWIDYQKKHETPENRFKQPPLQQQQQQKPATSSPNQLKKHSSTSSSLSSISSSCCDCNSNVSDFSIPRPRLIVPVHTYARKRRTGNLIQHQAGEQQQRYNTNNGNEMVVIEQPRNQSHRKIDGKMQMDKTDKKAQISRTLSKNIFWFL